MCLYRSFENIYVNDFVFQAKNTSYKMTDVLPFSDVVISGVPSANFKVRAAAIKHYRGTCSGGNNGGNNNNERFQRSC